MDWTPKTGTEALVAWIGPGEALATLKALLIGRIAGSTLTEDYWRLVLWHIGDGHAARLNVDSTGVRLAYWPRAWAARSLSYLGDPAAGPGLIEALADDHWRVRMTTAQALGRLNVAESLNDLVESLGDEHPRVRAAAVTALGRLRGPKNRVRD
jgi:hypothetical protein